MSKIKNWSRARDAEERFDHFEYYWDHDKDDRKHVAIRNYERMPNVENKYHLVFIENGQWNRIKEGNSVEPLRKRAVKWMKRHPNP